MSFLKGFLYAGKGIAACTRQERNFRFHIITALYTLRFSVFFDLTKSEYCVLILIISAVLCAEALNSAIENVVDLVCGTSKHPLAAKAKDIAAGAVLLCATGAVFIAVFLFSEKSGFIRIYHYYANSPIKIFIVVLLTVIAAIWIFSKRQNKQEDKICKK